MIKLYNRFSFYFSTCEEYFEDNPHYGWILLPDGPVIILNSTRIGSEDQFSFSIVS